jgi:dihydrofolate reductase
VLGRVTHEGFAASWPAMEEATGDFGKRMNSMPKFVASRTLETTEWNASLIAGHLAAEVAKLKEQPGDDLLIYGSAGIVTQLASAGLIDEYTLMVYPIVIGAGKRMFDEETPLTFRLEDATTTAAGVVVLTYSCSSLRPDSEEEQMQPAGAVA